MSILVFTLACTPKTASTSPPDAVVQPVAETPTGPKAEADLEAECRVLEDGRSVCFPIDHACQDPHGIGDGVAIEVDCWTSGGRMCNPSREIWPGCAGGWLQDS